MIIHFICRGNSFRSIIAEAYLNSLEIEDSRVLSSGTTAASDRAGNLAYYRMTLDLLKKHGIREFAKAGYGDQLTQSRLEEGDITVCMNQRVYDQCLRCVTFPASPRIWSVTDIGEPGRISNVESERELYREEAYQEIIKNVDRLVSDISAQASLALVAHKLLFRGYAAASPKGELYHQGVLPGTWPAEAHPARVRIRTRPGRRLTVWRVSSRTVLRVRAGAIRQLKGGDIVINTEPRRAVAP